MSRFEHPFVFQNTCSLCGKLVSIEVDREDHFAWSTGTPAHRAFPYLSAEEREIFISRICPECWEKLFGTDVEEEEKKMEEPRICPMCGCVIEKDDFYYEYNDEYYCEDCYDANFTACEECGEMVPTEELETVLTEYGEKWWCQDCIYDHSSEDYFTGERVDDDYCAEVYIDSCSSVTTSQDYAECNCYYCECCDNWVIPELWNHDAECCCDCAPDEYMGLITYYHAHKGGWTPVGKTKKGRREWYISPEIEVDMGDDRGDCSEEIDRAFPGHFVFEEDGSLDRGFEIIGQPHTLEEFYKVDWAKLFDICKSYGFKAHDAGTCGLHIHVTRTFFGKTAKEQERNIAKVIKFVEDNYDEIVKVSRRRSSEAYHWAGKYSVCEPLDRVKALGKARNEDRDRYKCVNVTNRDTVEIRIMRGTLRVSTFLACIDFIVGILTMSKKIKWKDIDNVALWLSTLKPETKEYIKSRDAFMEVM